MTTSFVLPDSTMVVLNSSSSLRYPSKFLGNKREVELTGEAFFSVKKDAKRKFAVKAFNKLEIVAYGTEFNVEAYSQDKLIQTTLVSGKVGLIIMNNKDRNNLMMYPGQKAIYDIKRKKIAVEEANIEVETSWLPAWSTSSKWEPQSTLFLENADYLRLKNISISYDFKVKKLADFRVSLSATNLFTITSYKGIDPESSNVGGGGSDIEQGIDYGSYPNSKTYTIGLNITF